MPPSVKPISSTRELAHRMTDDERAARTTELLDLEDKLEELVEERKAVVAEVKGRATDVRTRLKVLRTALRSGTELREVPCTTTLDYELKKFVTTRNDTEAVVDFRPASEEDLQGALFGTPDDPRPDATVLSLVPPAPAEDEPVHPAVAQALAHLAPDAPGAPPPAPKKTSRRKRADAVIREGDGPAHAPGQE